ncbi:MAG: tetratricopeptide repeat protein [Fodinibius sp.]|nr:tetratricopeptide repeat protein [Fodinibius sp.]
MRRIIIGSALLGMSMPLYAQELPITTQNQEAKTLFIEGRQLFDNIRFDEAREVFDQAIQQDPEFALANLYRALASTTDDTFNRYLGKAVSAKSEVSDGERMLIESMKSNADNQPMKAISSLKNALVQYPDDKRLYHVLGLAYQGVNNSQEAERQYRAAIDLEADFAPPYNNLGYLYREQQNYTQAEKAFKNYIRLLPTEANPHDSIGDLYTKMGDHKLAIEHYEKALALNPKFYFSRQKIGDNLIFQGQFTEGRNAYAQAMSIAPAATNRIMMQQALANTYLFENNYPRAVEEHKTAIRLSNQEKLPENAATLYQMLAFMQIEYGDFDRAEEALKASDEIVNNHTLTNNRTHSLAIWSLKNNALKAAKQGDWTTATQKAEKLKQQAEQTMNPNEMETYYLVAGVTAFEKGDYATAIEELKRSSFNSPYAQFYLAQSYQQTDKPADAQAIYEKVAQWNENTLEYGLVRNKARSAAKMEMVVE